MFLKGKSLKKEILSSSLTVVISVILLFLIISEINFYSLERKSVIKSSQQKTNLFVDQTNQIISNIKYNIKAYSTSLALQDTLTRNFSAGNYGDYLFNSAMKTSIINIMDIQNIVSDGIIISSEGRAYDITTNTSNFDISDEEKQLLENGRKSTSAMQISFMKNKQNTPCLNIKKKIIGIQTGEYLGVLSFDIINDLFEEKYNLGISEDIEKVYFTDTEGNYIAGSSKADFDNIKTDFSSVSLTSFLEKGYHFGSHNIYSINKVDDDIGYIIYQIDKNFVFRGAIKNGLVLLFAAIIVLLLSVLIFTILSKNISNPVEKLSAYALKVSNHKPATMPEDVAKREDEIGKLSNSIKIMVQNLNNLTNKIYLEQNEKREYELRLLQTQINPHFLYNCLDNLNTLITDDRKEDSYSMVKYLEGYYRSILSNGRSVITIAEELVLVENYVKIQLIKNPDNFTYSFNLPKDLGEFRILKMSLQPIVENSILHGFTENGGKLEINVQEQESFILIDVKDNGCGIEQNQLHSIFNSSEESIPTHFGLRSIQQRIQLKYGRMYGLTIDSIKGQGTTVHLKMPKRI